jgi:branched-chain amino acid transport system ATP-binding protein
MKGDVLLETKGLKVRYGQIEAVHGIDMAVHRGEIVTLIGANGAGKTSTLLAISGVQRPAAGIVRFMGQEIQRLPGHRIAALGLSHVPEGRRIFGRMTVWENLAMGTYAQGRTPNSSELGWIYELFPVLEQRSSQVAGTLSGGEQQMLAIGRALVGKPQLLLLDEPSMGLAPKLVQSIFGLLVQINKAGVTMLLIEQNARMALKVADRAYVLESGHVTRTANANEVLDDAALRTAYLGGDDERQDSAPAL